MLDANYNKAVDIWSLGCCLGEMLNCTKSVVDKIGLGSKKRIMFKGGSCYPISPIEQIANEAT